MSQQFWKRIFFKWLGFTEEVDQPLPEKCVIAMAPHTSNWDFIVGTAYSRATGTYSNFLMKKEWFFWPMGILMRHMGGIPVYRNKHTRATDTIAEQAKAATRFRLCITPEGTRKANAEWKRGFYYIALKANLPILLYGLDFKTRRVVCTKTVVPNGDVEAQMAEIKDYYKDFVGKHPHKFVC